MFCLSLTGCLRRRRPKPSVFTNTWAGCNAGYLLALISQSCCKCVEINFAILTTTISHFERVLDLIQIVESFSSRRRADVWVRPARTSAWWDNIRAGLAIRCVPCSYINNRKCRESKCKSQ